MTEETGDLDWLKHFTVKQVAERWGVSDITIRRMIDRKEIQETASNYDLDKVKVGMVASHSALDVCDGAIAEG